MKKQLRRVAMRRIIKDVTYLRFFGTPRQFLLLNVTIVLVVAIITSILLPMTKVMAETTLTWTNNSDFSFNKSSSCQATTISGVTVSGSAYTDGTCATTGTNSSVSLTGGQSTILSNVLAVSTTSDHTVAVKTDGTVWAWGANSEGQLGIGTLVDSVAAVQVKDAAGTGFLSGITSVKTSYNSSYALKNDGTVWAWGDNSSGQLGDNTTTRRSLPVQVKNSTGTGTLSGVKSIAAGGWHAAAVKTDGTMWTWGANDFGQIGDNTTSQRTLPVQVKDPAGTGTLSSVSSAVVAYEHTIALKTDGTVWAWGSNSSGQLGDNTTSMRLLPIQVKDAAGTGTLSGITSIAAFTGSVSTTTGGSYALKNDGSVWAWGSNTNGELGTNSVSANSRLPVQVKDAPGTGTLSGITAITAGARSVYALKNNGTLWAWGKNDVGQLGDGTTTNRSLPVQVKDTSGSGFITTAAGISAGGSADGFRSTTVSLMQDGTLLGWGSNNRGGLGYQQNGSSTSLPQIIASGFQTTRLDHVTQLSVARNHVLALKDDGTVWSWGRNTYGELGDNTTTDRTLPIQVKDPAGTGFLTNVKQVVAATPHDDFDGTVIGVSFAVKTDGTVWSWGAGSYLGDGTTTMRKLPVQVKDSPGTGFLTNVASLSSAGSHTVAVKNDGTVWSWGLNFSGQLGDNTTTFRNLPVQVRDAAGTGYLSGIVSVSAALYVYDLNDSFFPYGSNIAVKNDGTVWSWGNNDSAQLGDGTTTTRTKPVQVKDPSGTGFFSGASKAVISRDHAMVLKSDGTVWAWGDNSNKQLGDGTSTNRSLPVQVKDSTGTGFASSVADVQASDYRSGYLTTTGALYLFGTNYNKEGGNGTTAIVNYPTQVKNADGTLLTGVGSFSIYQSASLAVRTSGSTLGWGYTAEGLFSQGSMSAVTVAPTPLIASIRYDTAYKTTGTISGLVVDAGAGRRNQWNGVSWNSQALPSGTTVSVAARTSSDASSWSTWTSEYSQSTLDSTSGSATFSSLPYTRYLELRLTLTSNNGSATPTVDDLSVRYLDDRTAPATNASGLTAKKTLGGADLTNGAWTNTSPVISWSAAGDDVGGTGVQGYCVYVGTDQTANPLSSKGLLGSSPLNTDNTCPYATSSLQLDTAASGVLATALSSSTASYYVIIRAIDNANNVFSGSPASFSFKFDNTAPKNPSFISAPAGFVASKNVTLAWPNSGADAISDAHSGVVGLQYRIGASGTWYGDSHNGAQDASDVLANDGSYTLDPTVDYPLITEGNNTIYFRTLDVAGNASTTYTTAAIKINTSSPSQPQNIIATPSTNTLNSFSFAWQIPETFVGQAANLTYCYTINTLPNEGNCTYTSDTSLPTDAYATQPGTNTLYVVARDESMNINYDTYGTVTFTANTSAPGVPTLPEIADISTKATSVWKLAVSWSAPEDVGAGIARYQVYRSQAGGSYSQIATTSGASYVDSGLSPVEYSYKVRACDSANNCGAFSSVVTKTPTGRYTTPPELVNNPSVETGTRKATFSWVTDRDSDSRVQYGLSSGVYFPGEVAVSALAKIHSVDVPNLEAGTTYFYRVKWTDEDGNTGTSSEFSFTTLPAPTVKNVTVTKTTLSSATIRFTSDQAVKVSLYYGKGESFGNVKTINTSLSESTYDISLDGLDDGATYSYKLVTFDSDGNQYDSRRADTFTTPPRPRISNLRFQPVVGEPTSTQKVTWTTNVPTSTLITYGIDGSNGRDQYDAKLVTEHEMIISELIDNSSYFLLAQGQDIDGNSVVSDRQGFRTALDTRPPKISDIRVETAIKGNGSEARGQIIVSWKTDEPSTSQVSYAIGGSNNYSNQTVEDVRLTTEHVVIISDLPVSTIYHLQPVSRDGAENEAIGDAQSAIVGRGSDSILNVILNSLYKVFGI